ncbi:pentapeptide repeat-containing protein [Pararhodobacter oceanensis]|uniref:pentapeptide repeat-containing protein n=1 Tax=Pararhodobacter oceanensis TaxID=2172121 RepID=UPI003A933440
MPQSSPTAAQLLSRITADHGCSGQDLSAVDFDQLDTDEPLQFTDCTLTRARISGAALRESIWINCTFRDCVFSGTALQEAQFTRCGFYNPASVTGAMFQHCSLSSTRFTGCDLTLATFKSCDAHDIAFKDCQMRGTGFEATDFSQSLGRKRLNAAHFDECRLIDARFDRLDLSSCEFSGCDMTGIALTAARLVKARIKRCTLVVPEIGGADFSGADLSGSSLDGFHLPDLRAYSEMQVSAGQQHHLLRGLGVKVIAD